MLKFDFVVAVHSNVIIIILIQVMKDFESLTVVSFEYYCKVNPDCFTSLKMINSLKSNHNQLHYSSKVIEIVTLLNTF